MTAVVREMVKGCRVFIAHYRPPKMDGWFQPGPPCGIWNPENTTSSYRDVTCLRCQKRLRKLGLIGGVA